MNDDFMRELQNDFLTYGSDILDESEKLILSLEKQSSPSADDLEELKRLVHNFKGSAKTVGFTSIASLTHTFESLMALLSEVAPEAVPPMLTLLLECNDRIKADLGTLRNNPAAEFQHEEIIAKIEAAMRDAKRKDPADPSAPATSPTEGAPSTMEVHEAPPKDDFLRIPRSRIDDLLDAFGEQVIFLSALDHYCEDMIANQDVITRTIGNLRKLALDLQQSTLVLRTVSMKGLFSKLERSIRDASKMTGKQADCVTYGNDQELDKVIVDQIADPLNHIVRNAVDHGLETPEEREALGKPARGQIALTARREGASFVIEIQDDGKGMNPEKIRQKAIEKGLIAPETVLTEQETLDLIFENGFSTKEEVSELSGRGVGMNVVKDMILALKGSYEIESKIGEGTLFRLKLPLSLSLFNGMLIRINEDKYVVPSSQVAEIVETSAVELRREAQGKCIFQLREQIYELVDLTQLLRTRNGSASPSEPTGMILICNHNSGKVGYLVSQIYNIQRVVQKSLAGGMVSMPGATGATILGDGSPSIILDLGLIKPQEPKTPRALQKAA